MKPKLLVIGENVEFHVDHFAQSFEIYTLTDKEDPDAFLTEIAPEIEGLAMSGGANPRCDAALLDRLPKLSIVASIGVGHGMVDMEEVKARNLVATYGPGGNATSVADFALALMLAVTRQIIPWDREARVGTWAATGLKGGYTSTITEKTVGIIGLGAIGRAVAKRCTGFDIEVLYHQRHENSDSGLRYITDVREMATQSQFLVTCCPATDETFHMVDADVLAALGSDGYLISVSRGTVIDEAALITALQDRIIAGAGLEVFEHEPDIPAEFAQMDNVVLSTHRSAFTYEATILMRDMMMANLTAHFAGEPVPNPVPDR